MLQMKVRMLMSTFRYINCLALCLCFCWLSVTAVSEGACRDYGIPDELEPLSLPPVPEPPVCYRDPSLAMMRRYKQPVDIDISPSWGLSEQQMFTAQLPPYGIVRNGRVVRYVYPEDENPTIDQLADGSALTDRQRRLMRRARRQALRNAAWQAKMEAERYNREHAEVLAARDKQGRYIVITLSRQSGCFMDGETVLRSFRVCTGKKSTPTPKGHFHVMEKRKTHKSNLYNSSMPYFLRLTLDGVGLHQGPVRSRPSSHGCIRLNRDDAHYIFENSVVGTAVFVTD